MIVTLPIGVALIADGVFDLQSVMAGLYLSMLPMMIAFPIVLLSSIVIGIPTACVLSKAGDFRERSYRIVGVVAGTLIPVILLIALGAKEGFWMALLGAFSGFVTAEVWSRATR